MSAFHLLHPKDIPVGNHRPAEFSCIWVDSPGGGWVWPINSVSDDPEWGYINWIADCLVAGDRVACILHLMF